MIKREGKMMMLLSRKKTDIYLINKCDAMNAEHQSQRYA